MLVDVGHVVSAYLSRLGRKCGVAAEVPLPSISVQKLFLLPVCVVAICVFHVSGRRAMSSVAYLSRNMSKM